MSKLTKEEKLAQAARFQANTERLSTIINPIRVPRYSCHVGFAQLRNSLESWTRDYGLDMQPEFQRGRVWSDAQRIAYIEGILRGTVPEALRVITWNSPAFGYHNPKQDGLGETLLLVDGKQRLNAVLDFMDGKIKPFGLDVSDLLDSAFSPKMSDFSLVFKVLDFPYLRDVLDYYLRVNRGGTPHSEAELNRVAQMLAACSQ